MAKGSVLEEDVLLGKNVFVGEKSTLHQAIIGANCQIGKNVSIRNCIIYDNVIIGDNCQLVDSVCAISRIFLCSYFICVISRFFSDFRSLENQ